VERTWEVLATDLRFPEGPIAMRDGSIVLVEIRGGDLTRVTPDGTKETVAHLGGGPNGAAVGPDGNFYVCNNGGYEWGDVHGLLIPVGTAEPDTHGYIQRVNAQTGEAEVLYDSCNGVPLSSPNDIVFDTAGGFWFTDLGHGRGRTHDVGGLYYAAADGSSIREAVWPVDDPNGIGLSPDGTKLYTADSVHARVWSWDLAAPGEIKEGGVPFAPPNASLLYAFGELAWLDSLAVDSSGAVCVATLIKGGISVIATDGTLEEFVAVPQYDPAVTNICFGGDDLRTAYITSSGFGILYATQWSRPGAPLAFLNV
jgi:gluconolactonase